MEQIRLFSLPEKIKILSERTQPQYGSLLNNQTFSPTLTWSSVNALKHQNSLKLKTKLLIIYPYSISNNLLKEVLLRMGINFILTNEVKKAIVGTGRASKSQVQEMVKRLLRLNKVAGTDASDALAVAICAAHHRELQQRLQQLC